MDGLSVRRAAHWASTKRTSPCGMEKHTHTCGRRFGDLKQMWNMKEHVFDVPKTGEWEGSARGSLVCPDGSVGWMFGHVL